MNAQSPLKLSDPKDWRLASQITNLLGIEFDPIAEIAEGVEKVGSRIEPDTTRWQYSFDDKEVIVKKAGEEFTSQEKNLEERWFVQAMLLPSMMTTMLNIIENPQADPTDKKVAREAIEAVFDYIRKKFPLTKNSD